MHIVTGGAGFIGSAMVWKLNRMGVADVWLVDDLGDGEKWKNLPGLRFSEIMSPMELADRMEHGGALPDDVDSIFHMGACSSTTERDADYLLENNFKFSRLVAEFALARQARLVVASSAAVYGGGELGYGDDEADLRRLRPLNMYGYSKLLFEQWADRSGALARLACLRFFNVYGPNEYHKGDMASMVFKSYRRVADEGKLSLFRSHRPDYADGEQRRDFVYVKDVVDVMWWLLERPEANGIYNVGTGTEATWNELARAVFAAVGKEPRIDYADMPEAIRHQYQYRTRADMDKLRRAGYAGEFRPIAEGVGDYVAKYLMSGNPHLANA